MKTLCANCTRVQYCSNHSNIDSHIKCITQQTLQHFTVTQTYSFEWAKIVFLCVEIRKEFSTHCIGIQSKYNMPTCIIAFIFIENICIHAYVHASRNRTRYYTNKNEKEREKEFWIKNSSLDFSFISSNHYALFLSIRCCYLNTHKIYENRGFWERERERNVGNTSLHRR